MIVYEVEIPDSDDPDPEESADARLAHRIDADRLREREARTGVEPMRFQWEGGERWQR